MERHKVLAINQERENPQEMFISHKTARILVWTMSGVANIQSHKLPFLGIFSPKLTSHRGRYSVLTC